MAEILGDTILHLNGLTAEPVHFFETGFGAGKTHTLILLYQIISNPDLGMRYINKIKKLNKKLGAHTIPDTKIVAIDCRQIKHNTLWGEIAHKMGEYALFEKYDKTHAYRRDHGALYCLTPAGTGQDGPGKRGIAPRRPDCGPFSSVAPLTAQGRQPLKGAASARPPLPEETKPPRKQIKLTPELAGKLLLELDISAPYYYTKEKRRDPFEELKDRGVDLV